MSQRRQQPRGRPKRGARESHGTRKSCARARILEQRGSKTKCLLDIKKTLKALVRITDKNVQMGNGDTDQPRFQESREIFRTESREERRETLPTTHRRFWVRVPGPS